VRRLANWCLYQGGGCNAAGGGGGSGSEDERGSGVFKSGACVGDGVSGSEETVIIGGLRSLGMVTKGMVEKADTLFRVRL
jgi:hypothetical protein